MTYAIAARLHAAALTMMERARSDRRGQGTVEYVGVVVMVTLLIAALAGAATTWAPAIGTDLKGAIGKAIEKASGGL